MAANMDALSWWRLEGTLLILKEVGCAQKRIHMFVLEDNVLPLLRDSLKIGGENIVRACLFVLRQFAFSDDMKELFAMETETAQATLKTLKKYSDKLPIVEQAFGLFSNLTLRKPHIAEHLNKEPNRIVAIGQLILQRHLHEPNVVKTVLCTLRNVSKAVPDAGTELVESGFFDVVRQIYFDHFVEGGGARARSMQEAQKWIPVLDICKQFLREFRLDDGIRKAAVHNEYY